jgi:hypothetical protein
VIVGGCSGTNAHRWLVLWRGWVVLMVDGLSEGFGTERSASAAGPEPRSGYARETLLSRDNLDENARL